MKVGDLVQVRLPTQKGQGVLLEKVHFDLPADGGSEHYYKIATDAHWTVLYEGGRRVFHQHNLEVIK